MLGDKIGETSGKITSQRVLPNLGGSPKMETLFQANRSILGTDLKETGTYWTMVRPDDCANSVFSPGGQIEHSMMSGTAG
jgi:hypothetical protein